MASAELQPLDSTTLAEQAYEAVRNAIISGQLEPGAKITDRGLAASLAVSATPVREAIRRLQQDHLVERVGARTVRVMPHSTQTRAEIALIESSLKGVAARLSAVKISDERVDELSACLDEADRLREVIYSSEPADDGLDPNVAKAADELIETLRRFHRLVNEASGNEVLLHMLRTTEAFSVRDRKRALRQRLEGREAGPADRYAEHRQILAALRAHDAALAEHLVLGHSRSANNDLLTCD